MTITAKIIEDSTNGAKENGRLTTFELEMPRFILAQFNTHRVNSRNAASSRAIPLKRRIESIMSDPVMPVRWGKNEPGMVATEEVDPDQKFAYGDTGLELSAKEAWLYARDRAVEAALHLDKIGVHKELVNRLVETFSYVRVVASATNFANFFQLRRHPHAQPEIIELADVMWDAYKESTPKLLKADEWHLPYVTEEERKNLSLSITSRMSVARCARVSYLTHDGATPDIDADLKLYERLVGSVPLHASPAEHQATAGVLDDYGDWVSPGLSGNFGPGWIQYRKLLPNEYIEEYKESA